VTKPWNARELATLAAIATTFVPGADGPHRAERIVEALATAADPAQVSQLRWVLAALENRVASLALGTGPTPFRDLDQAGRERVLQAWGASRVAQRRTAYQALRKLSTFLAYADPNGPGGADTVNPRHAAIGYRLERPAPTAEPTAIVPHVLPFQDGAPDAPMVLDADIVIVGSGAGGGVVAAAAAAAGRSVVVLEGGPFVDERTMPNDELDAFSRLYLDRGLLATWDGAVTLLAGSGVGGGTLVNWMTMIEAPSAVRDTWRTEHGLAGLADGDAWTDDVAAIETELAITPTAYQPPKDEAILRGAAALGWEAAPIRRNGRGCDDCGSCAFGCPRGTKRSSLRAHLADAAASGARIVPRVRVGRVLLDGGRAVGVEGIALVPDPVTDGPIPDPVAARGIRVRPLRVYARQVVIAGGALRTPAVLEGSGLTHPAIGRHLVIHPVTGVLTRMPTPVELWRGPMQAARSLEFGDATRDRHGYAIESAPAHPGLLALALPWEGAAAHQALMDDSRHLGALIAVTRDGGEGRTSLTRAGRVRLDYRLDAMGVATLRHAAASCARLGRAAGAVDIVVPGIAPAWFRGGTPGRTEAAAFEHYLERLASLDFRPNRGLVFSAHQMGTARMGTSPREHVCDPDGRVRVGPSDDRVVAGLYVADTSLFPTALGVNPMLTVMALARRVARTVLAEG
jgi:choline dehydrogenase-like flavoprotein